MRSSGRWRSIDCPPHTRTASAATSGAVSIAVNVAAQARTSSSSPGSRTAWSAAPNKSARLRSYATCMWAQPSCFWGLSRRAPAVMPGCSPRRYRRVKSHSPRVMPR